MLNNNLKGKKLLILGANPETIPLVRKANELGVITYVTSGRKTDPAKKYANFSYDIDGLDVDHLVDLVRNENIDGVLVGVADILVPSYYDVCKKLNYPCYVNEKTKDISN